MENIPPSQDDAGDAAGDDTDVLYTRMGYIKGKKREFLIAMDDANAIVRLIPKRTGLVSDRVQASVHPSFLRSPEQPLDQSFASWRVSRDPRSIPLVGPTITASYQSQREIILAAQDTISPQPPRAPQVRPPELGISAEAENPQFELVPIGQNMFAPTENRDEDDDFAHFPRRSPRHSNSNTSVSPPEADSGGSDAENIDSDLEEDTNQPYEMINQRLERDTREYVEDLYVAAEEEFRRDAEEQDQVEQPTLGQEWRQTVTYGNSPAKHPLVLLPPLKEHDRERFFGPGGHVRHPPFNGTPEERVRHFIQYPHLTLPPPFIARLRKVMNDDLKLRPPISLPLLYRFFGAQLLMAQQTSRSRKVAFEYPIWGISLRSHISIEDYKRIYHALMMYHNSAPSLKDREREVDTLWRYLNQHMPSIVNPGSYLHMDESMVMWRGRDSSWVDGPPQVFFMQQKPIPRGFLFKTLADAESKVIIYAEPQQCAETMRARLLAFNSDIKRATSATLARALDDSGLSAGHARDSFGITRVIVADSWFSAEETARVALERGCHYVGAVSRAAGFPTEQLSAHPNVVLEKRIMISSPAPISATSTTSTSSSSSAASSSLSSELATTAARTRLIFASSLRSKYGNQVKFIHTFNPRDTSIIEIYRKNNHAVDNNNQVRSYINVENATLVRNYKQKNILAFFALCITNAYLLYSYEHKITHPQEPKIDSVKFSVEVARHFLTYPFEPVNDVGVRALTHTYQSIRSINAPLGRTTHRSRCAICGGIAYQRCVTCSTSNVHIDLCSHRNVAKECMLEHEKRCRNGGQ